MREGKYIDEVYRRVCELQSGENALQEVLGIANDVAREHPVWFERWRIRSVIIRGWRWVTGRTFGATSKRRGGSNENGDGGGGCGDG